MPIDGVLGVLATFHNFRQKTAICINFFHFEQEPKYKIMLFYLQCFYIPCIDIQM